MNKVRIAVAGAGVIGKRHIAAIADCDRAVLAAIADPAAPAAALARKLEVPRFGDVASMLAAEKPDGVIVATPTAHHVEPALACLDAGAHVLVEKPIAATTEQAALLVERSAACNRHILVGHHRRYYECVRRSRELVQGGALGRLVGVTGQWTTRKDDAYYAADWRKQQAAGPVLTNLVHEMDSLRFICGEVESICGEIGQSILGFEKEDAAAIVMRFCSGALGTFLLSDQTYSPWSWEMATGENPAFPPTGQNALRFMGTDAALEFPNLVIWHKQGGAPDWHHAPRPDAIATPLADAYLAQITHFCDVVSGISTPLVPAGDAARTLAATIAVFDAARSGARVLL